MKTAFGRGRVIRAAWVAAIGMSLVLACNAVPAVASDDGLSAISCPTALLCVTPGLTSTQPTGGSSAWRPFAVPGDAKDAGQVSCSPRGFCAMNTTYGVITSADPTGGSRAWTLTAHGGQVRGSRSEPDPFNGDGVACAGVSMCVAGDAVSLSPGASPFVWSDAPRRGVRGAGLSCPSVSLCVGFGVPDTSMPYGTTVWHSTKPLGGPRAWSYYTIPYVDPQSMTCPTISLCVGVAARPGTSANSYNAGEFGIVYSTDPSAGPGGWIFTPLPQFPNPTDLVGIAHISCASTSLCVVTALDGRRGQDEILWSSDPTGAPSAWSSGTIPGAIGLRAPDGVSCPTATFCAIAADDYPGGGVINPEVLTSTDPAGGPSTWATTPVSSSVRPLTARKLMVAHAAITGLAAGHPKLAFTVRRGASAPGFWGLHIQLPRGLHFGHCCTASGLRWLARHTQISSPGTRHINFAYNRLNSDRSWEELLFDSEFALWSAHVTIRSPSLLADPTLVRDVKLGRTKYVTVVISGDGSDPPSNTRRVRVRIS